MDELDQKTSKVFRAFVRKDMTRRFKAAWPDIPAHVIEYYLGRYCATTDPVGLQMGEELVHKKLEEFFPPARARTEFMKRLNQAPRSVVLDRLRLKTDGSGHRASLQFLRARGSRIHAELANRLLGDSAAVETVGIWAEVTLEPEPGGAAGSVRVVEASPIELTTFSLDQLRDRRGQFSASEWIDLLVRSLGYESEELDRRTKLLVLCRLLPLIEPGLRLIEIAPPGRGKSYVYQEVSPFGVVVESAKTSPAQLFGHAASRRPGLVGSSDMVAFDSGLLIDRFPGEMADHLARYVLTGEYERGKNAGHGSAGVVLVLDQRPGTADDSAANLPRRVREDPELLAGFDFLLPGWELPRLGAERVTKHLGLVLEVLGKALHALREEDLPDPLVDFDCGDAVSGADRRSIRAVLKGLLKLVFPHGESTQEERVELLLLAAEGRRRIKEILRRRGSVEHFATGFSFKHRDTGAQWAVELGGAPSVATSGEEAPPGVLRIAGTSDKGVVGLWRLEVNVLPGRGDFEFLGRVDPGVEDSLRAGLGFLHENAQSLGVSEELPNSRLQVQLVDELTNAVPVRPGLGVVLAACSALRDLPCPKGVVIAGDMTVKGQLAPVRAPESLVSFLLANGAAATWLPFAPSQEGDLPGATYFRSPKHAAKLMFGEALAPVPGQDQWLRTLPYPLASILDFYECAAEPKTRYRALLAFFEYLAAFHSTALLSGLAGEQDHEATLRGVTKCLSFELGTFGLWRGVYTNLSKRLRGFLNTDPAGMCELFGVRRAEVLHELSAKDLIAVFEDTGKLRNDWKGHDTVALSDEQALEREERLVPLLARVRRATPTLWSEWQLVRVRRMTRKAGKWQCTVDRLRGPNPTFKWAAVETDDYMDEDLLYLLDETVGSPRPVVPLVRLSSGSVAYFYDRRDERGLRWLSQHSAVDNERFEDVPQTVAWLDRVKALSGDGES